MKNKKAFSLIELSIVLLIIGIIVAGITQSSRMISAFRLSSARAQTQSSPVTSIKDLVAWWETTSENSFAASETDNGSLITNWYDINPQTTTTKKIISQSGIYRPTYVANGINNVPAIGFDVALTQSFVMAAYDADFNQSTFTIFAVIQPSTAARHLSILQSTNGFNGYTLYVSPTPNYEFWFGNGSSYIGNGTNNTAATLNKAAVLTATYDKTAATNNLTLYKNTTTVGSLTSTTGLNTVTALRIGASSGGGVGGADYFFNGKIGEVIFFSRVLKTEERQAIQNYLIKKWSIT